MVQETKLKIGDKVRKLPGAIWDGRNVGEVTTITQQNSLGFFADAEGWLFIPQDVDPNHFKNWPWELVVDEDDPTSPKHYSKGMPEGVEVIDIIRAQGWLPGFAAGNALKYLLRYQYKNGTEDLKKARVYLDWLIEHKESNG